MKLLGVIPGGRAKERAIHERLAEYRLNRREELFHPHPVVMAVIGQLLRAGASTDAVEGRPDMSETRPKKKMTGYQMVEFRAPIEVYENLQLVAALRRQSMAACVVELLRPRLVEEVGLMLKRRLAEWSSRARDRQSSGGAGEALAEPPSGDEPPMGEGEEGIIKPRFTVPLDPEAAARQLLKHFHGAALAALVRLLSE